MGRPSTDEYTHIDEADVFQCNNCGAHNATINGVEHHATCQPGEAKKWEKFYSEEVF